MPGLKFQNPCDGLRLWEIQGAFDAFQVEDTSDQATDMLRTAALKDPDTRQFLVERLPALIEKPYGKVWENSVHLAGNIKMTEAIPTLARQLADPYTKGAVTGISIALRLHDDPPEGLLQTSAIKLRTLLRSCSGIPKEPQGGALRWCSQI